MALPQQLPGVSVVPQAPQVDPRLFAPDAAGMLLSARAGVQLGTELAGLQNLQGKLELEKAEIAARKAQNAYQQKLATDAAQILPQQIQSQLDRALAESAQSKATVRTADPLANAAIADAASRTAGSQFSLAQIKAGIDAGIPQFTVNLTKQKLENEAATTLADADWFAKLDTPGQKEAVAKGEAAGTGAGSITGPVKGAMEVASPTFKSFAASRLKTGLMEGALDDVFTNPPPGLIEYRTFDFTNPTNGQIEKGELAFNKLNGARVPSADRETRTVVRPGDSPDAKKVIGLKQTKDMAEAVREVLDPYASKDRGGYWQTVAARWANNPGEGMLTIGQRALGTELQRAETATVNERFAALSNTLFQSLSGGQITSNEYSRLSTMVPTTGDLVNPAAAKAKLEETINYLNILGKPYESRQSNTQARVGSLTGPSTDTRTSSATTPTFKAPDGWTAVTGPNSTQTVNGQEQQMLSKVNPKTGLPVHIWVNK
jgi:hypothetical protein